MINHKGQALVPLIILIPIFIVLIAIAIQSAQINYEKRKLYSVTETIIANCIDRCQKDDIINLYNNNGIDVDKLEIDNTSGLTISFETTIKNNFKSLIDGDGYHTKIKMKGFIEDNKVKYEKGN